MQKALPYRDWRPATAGGGGGGESTADPAPGSTSIVIGDRVTENVKKLVAENSVVVFARRGCCMCHVVKLLLHGHGVNPSIFDVEEQNEGDVKNELIKIIGAVAAPQFPAVFVGGKLFGGLEEVMGAHISGELVPRLREARALWL